MLAATIRGLGVLLLLGLCPGCLTYTNRVSYSARTDAFPVLTQAAVSPVKVYVRLQRESTAGVLPFVFTLGEKGDYSFSVQFYHSTKLPYQGGLIRAFSIISPAGVLYQSPDSIFMRHVDSPLRPDSFHLVYDSPYVIAVADSSNHLTFTLDYTLLTSEGKRESYHLEQSLRVARDKGFSFFSN
jgi:hypothetical protein